MVQITLKNWLKLNRLVGELYGIMEGLEITTGNEGPHPVPPSVLDPDTGREIPVEAIEGSNLTSSTSSPSEEAVEVEDDPEVQYEEVGLGTPT